MGDIKHSVEEQQKKFETSAGETLGQKELTLLELYGRSFYEIPEGYSLGWIKPPKLPALKGKKAAFEEEVRTAGKINKTLGHIGGFMSLRQLAYAGASTQIAKLFPNFFLTHPKIVQNLVSITSFLGASQLSKDAFTLTEEEKKAGVTHLQKRAEIAALDFAFLLAFKIGEKGLRRLGLLKPEDIRPYVMQYGDKAIFQKAKEVLPDAKIVNKVWSYQTGRGTGYFHAGVVSPEGYKVGVEYPAITPEEMAKKPFDMRIWMSKPKPKLPGVALKAGEKALVPMLPEGKLPITEFVPPSPSTLPKISGVDSDAEKLVVAKNLLDNIYKARIKESQKGVDTFFQFYSPNIEKDITLRQAASRLKSRAQKDLNDFSSIVDKNLGLTVLEKGDTVEIWKDGAENSIFKVVQSKDKESVILSAALKGRYGWQKQVFVFNVKDKGPDLLYRLKFPPEMKEKEIYDIIMKAEIPFGSIYKEGSEFLLVDSKKELINKVNELQKQAAQQNIEIGGIFVEGENIAIGDPAGESREVAIQSYDQIIRTILEKRKLSPRDLHHNLEAILDNDLIIGGQRIVNGQLQSLKRDKLYDTLKAEFLQFDSLDTSLSDKPAIKPEDLITRYIQHTNKLGFYPLAHSNFAKDIETGLKLVRNQWDFHQDITKSDILEKIFDIELSRLNPTQYNAFQNEVKALAANYSFNGQKFDDYDNVNGFLNFLYQRVTEPKDIDDIVVNYTPNKKIKPTLRQDAIDGLNKLAKKHGFTDYHSMVRSWQAEAMERAATNEKYATKYLLAKNDNTMSLADLVAANNKADANLIINESLVDSVTADMPPKPPTKPPIEVLKAEEPFSEEVNRKFEELFKKKLALG